MKRLEDAINESERLWEEEYDPKVKSENAYCHEQSFKWGFQEGMEYADRHPKRYTQDELCDIQAEMMRQRDNRLLEKVIEVLKENIDLYTEVVINMKSGYSEIVFKSNFEEEFKQSIKTKKG